MDHSVLIVRKDGRKIYQMLFGFSEKKKAYIIRRKKLEEAITLMCLMSTSVK